MSNQRVPVIYDTDLGEDIDDLYALYLALFHPRLELIAVTTVHGDTQAKARLAKKVLRLAGRNDVPVGAGIGMSEARRSRAQTSPDPARAATFVRYVTPGDPEWGQVYPSAQGVIRSALEASAEPVSLIGEGAFSNLGDAVQTLGSVRDKIRHLALMGGETQAQWNEYNVLCDPEAADVVLNCGLPVFLGTYFLTAQLHMTMDEAQAAFGDCPSLICRVLSDCTALWGPSRGVKTGPVLYDLVPVFWVADSALVETCESTIRVELNGTYTRGQTVRTGSGGSVLESLGLDAPGLVAKFVETIRAASA